MKTISLEQVLLLIAVFVLPLFNLLFQRIKRHFEAQPPEEESMPVIAKAEKKIPQQRREPRIPRDQHHEIHAPEVSTSLPVINSARKMTLGSRREIRRGIVLVTVLGSCRALDPPNWNR